MKSPFNPAVERDLLIRHRMAQIEELELKIKEALAREDYQQAADLKKELELEEEAAGTDLGQSHLIRALRRIQ